MDSQALKTLKHNIIVNVLDGAFFGCAMGFASSITVLPLFISTLTSSAILIGLIPVLHSAGWQLPQLFTARAVARQRRYKPMVMLLTANERFPFLVLVFIAIYTARLGAPVSLWITFSLLTWQGLGGGITANGWQAMIAKIIPSDYRGRFLGLQAAGANTLAAIGAVAAGAILEALESPLDFSLCFLLAFIALIISWIFLGFTRETESEPADLVSEQADFWKNLGNILQRDRNFRRFLAGRTITQLAFMGTAFYTVFAVHQHGISEGAVGVMTGVFMAVQILMNPLMGWLGDRWNRKAIMEIGLVCITASALVAWSADSPASFYAAFILAGIGGVANWTVGMAMTLEFGTEKERPAYIGLGNTLIAPAGILAPFLGGWLAEASGYPAAFIASALGGLAAAIIFRFTVREPKHVKARLAEIA